LAVGAAWDIDIWASLEVNIGLLCASAPALKPLIRKVFPSLFASRAEDSSGRNIGTYSTGGSWALRAPSRGGLDSSVELTGRYHDTCTDIVTQKELQSVTSAEVGIDGETFLDTSTRDIESDADGT